jgi:activator of 2-hydroxyglutaryl-CoA dehydratase
MFVGIDIGSATTKAVIINEQEEIVAFLIIPTGSDRQKAGKMFLHQL